MGQEGDRNVRTGRGLECGSSATWKYRLPRKPALAVCGKWQGISAARKSARTLAHRGRCTRAHFPSPNRVEQVSPCVVTTSAWASLSVTSRPTMVRELAVLSGLHFLQRTKEAACSAHAFLQILVFMACPLTSWHSPLCSSTQMGSAGGIWSCCELPSVERLRVGRRGVGRRSDRG